MPDCPEDPLPAIAGCLDATYEELAHELATADYSLTQMRLLEAWLAYRRTRLVEETDGDATVGETGSSLDALAGSGHA
jgi:hypothetical protein